MEVESNAESCTDVLVSTPQHSQESDTPADNDLIEPSVSPLSSGYRGVDHPMIEVPPDVDEDFLDL